MVVENIQYVLLLGGLPVTPTERHGQSIVQIWKLTVPVCAPNKAPTVTASQSTTIKIT